MLREGKLLVAAGVAGAAGSVGLVIVGRRRGWGAGWRERLERAAAVAELYDDEELDDDEPEEEASETFMFRTSDAGLERLERAAAGEGEDVSALVRLAIGEALDDGGLEPGEELPSGSRLVRVRITAGELAELAAAAEGSGVSRSLWLRRAIGSHLGADELAA